MDIKSYIQSGIIESYVLGMASDEEVAEIENLRSQYAEVQEAIDSFSLSLEKEAIANAIPPPPDVKKRIFNSLAIAHDEEERRPLLTTLEAPASVRQTPIRKLNWKIAAAASIILLAGSLAANIYLYNKYTSTSLEYQALLLERNTLQASNNVYQTRLREWQSAAEMMADPSIQMVKMAAVAGKSDVMATVFWDNETKDVYLLPNKLPLPTSGKQYQLWAMVDGKPVDAGVLDPNCSSVCKMKNIPKAQAFAITLEKEGGSPTPDLTQLFVMGSI